ncbi:LOW QUALITY PROTEIN: probable pyridoxal 5'-phosphate synthase subunit PDX2 [Dendrobium catenatum]|uniref:LOW QUALITY PROTEIN: probable pyridoxal 5'-phosphate synthase subunit PDX2 n=1 Tax=Dendrobium catenatum TaxID=906689 RepID=UPI00109F8EB8|nr:LOW QUALITY PROTEIN: probable pyridoxal 5'-phosphate synthase subunit PDX2 [Dendrobium catenatum]
MAVGVLALQGSFNEHMAALRRLGVTGVEVRKPSQLEAIEALIIPGGESTTMAKLAHYHNLFPALRDFVSLGKPVWGTLCLLIFLANKLLAQKLGVKKTYWGALDCTVSPNTFFGSQIQSLRLRKSFAIADSQGKVIVAVRQGNILGTAFHPELTSDIRWHSYFLKMRKASDETSLECLDLSNQNSYYHLGRRTFDLPIFE